MNIFQAAAYIVEAVFAFAVLIKLPGYGNCSNSVGSRLRVFSKVSDTSAMPDAVRVREPLNIRSSRLSERSAFILCSPITQRIASTIFDLPQPFGPTIPVIGLSSMIWVLSAKDLNPFISNDFNFKAKKFRREDKDNLKSKV